MDNARSACGMDQRMPETNNLRAGFTIGEWQVLPDRNLLRSQTDEAGLERLAMDVLVVLAARQGELVTKDDLVDAVWHGRPQMDDVITQKVSLIRKALGDMSRPHRYVETIFGRGYRMKMPVTLPERPSGEAEDVVSRRGYWLALAGGIAAITAVFVMVFVKPDGLPQDAADARMSSVVVFPFQCSNEQDDYLCDGFSATLSSTLSQLDGLQIVKSRTPYPANQTDIEIAQRFGVNGVIWGNVNRVGAALAINVDLVDGRSGYLEFTRVYNTDMDTLIDTQEQVANDVRRSIRGDESPTLMTSSRPANFQVLEQLWKADYEFAKRSPVSIRKAIDFYKQTIELDPGYGLAYVRLAYAYALLPDYSHEGRDEMYTKALETAAKGVQMDSSIQIRAATVYGFVHHKRGDWIAAQNYYEQSLAGDAGLAETHQLYSRLLASVGRLEDSLEQAKRAREMDPDSAVLVSRLAISYYWMNDVENAKYLFELTVDRPDLVLPINDMAYALLLLSQKEYRKATVFARTALENANQDSSWVEPVFNGLENPEQKEEALKLVHLLAENDLLPPNIQITLWTLFGHIDEAMEIARRMENEGEIFEAELLFSPDFRLFRQHPGFLPLMDATGIAGYWDEFGCRWQADRVQCDDPAGI